MKNSGFTLIELVVVMVLLGILLVVAAPKFLNSQSDARIAALDGFIAQFHTADTIAVSKAAITGVDDSDGDVLLPGTDVYVNRGYISLKADNVKNAMNTTGYSMENFMGNNIPLLMIGLGEDVDFSKSRTEQCFVMISRSFGNFGANNQLAYGDLKITKYYRDC